MKAIVVYESHWGNTASVARAIAEGLGVEALRSPRVRLQRLRLKESN